MSEFEAALAEVESALAQMQAEGRTGIRANVAALHELVTAAKTKPAPVAAPARPVAPEPTPKIQEQPPASYVEEPKAELPVNRVAETVADRESRIAEIRSRVMSCTRCPHLVASRTQPVFGVGNIYAELMFVGEAPGEDEDLQGEPFVGRAGELLTKIIKAMEFERSDVFIANVLKCRPNMPEGESGNRKPRGEEMQTCLPYLIEQIEIIRPKVIVALGATAYEGLTGSTTPIGKVRGRWQDFRGIPLMVTYHPAYLLRNQSNTEKRKVWEDMLLVLERLEKPISEKQRGYFLSK